MTRLEVGAASKRCHGDARDDDDGDVICFEGSEVCLASGLSGYYCTWTTHAAKEQPVQTRCCPARSVERLMGE